MKTATIVIHYPSNDKSFRTDYCSVDVIIDKKKVRDYLDGYHENGVERAEHFVDGLKFCFPELNIERKQIADGYPNED